MGGKACLYVIIILRASEKEMRRWKGAGANQEGDKRLKSSLEINVSEYSAQLKNHPAALCSASTESCFQTAF